MDNFSIGRLVAANIAQQFGVFDSLSSSQEQTVEKARQVGEVHPNGKWVWTQLSNGKYDWRVIKKQGGGSPQSGEGGKQPTAQSQNKQPQSANQGQSGGTPQGGNSGKSPIPFKNDDDLWNLMKHFSDAAEIESEHTFVPNQEGLLFRAAYEEVFRNHENLKKDLGNLRESIVDFMKKNSSDLVNKTKISPNDSDDVKREKTRLSNDLAEVGKANIMFKFLENNARLDTAIQQLKILKDKGWKVDTDGQATKKFGVYRATINMKRSSDISWYEAEFLNEDMKGTFTDLMSVFDKAASLYKDIEALK